MQIIGLGHYSRTGKDSFANYFLAELAGHQQQKSFGEPQIRAKKVPFAWKLKQIAFELYAWDGMREPEFYETPSGETYRNIKLPTIGKTPVEIWIDLGTPAVRDNVYDRTWIDYVLKSDHQADVLVVPDVRFPNEVAAMKDLGATLIKVVRPGYGPRQSVADRALLNWGGWDYVIGSTGRMDELKLWANIFAGWIVGKNPKPEQSEDARRDALMVEKINAEVRAA